MKAKFTLVSEHLVDLLEPQIQLAAEAIREGRLVAFPTETVYGLGANALDAQAVRKIFVAKGRPLNDPLIVHVCPDWLADAGNGAATPHPYLEALFQQGIIGELTETQQARLSLLIHACWPGPLTLVLPRGEQIPMLVTAGGNTVAIRMPQHPIALALIAASGVPIAAPSANRFGHVSPTTAQHVRDDLAERVEIILDGGATSIGVESTVLNALPDVPIILRHGGVTKEQIEQILGQTIIDSKAADLTRTVLPSPGLLERHYAPDAALQIMPDFAALVQRWGELTTVGQQVGLLLTRAQANAIPNIASAQHYVLGETLEDIARNLYAGLRALDSADVQFILMVALDRNGLGAAIMDRLQRGAVRDDRVTR